MEEFRTAGNALFAAKDYAKAIDKYSEGLSAAEEAATTLSKSEVDAQCALLWSNRAACHLQLEQFEQALADCCKALGVDVKSEKARYRRAQAYVGLGNYADAFKDIHLVLQIHPNNKAAVALARKIKDVVQSDVHGVQKALDTITKSIDGGVDGFVGQQKLTEEALKYLEMKSVQDLSSLPREVEEKGGLIVLWRVVKYLLEWYGSDSTKASHREAIGSVLSHVVSLLAIVASSSMPLASLVYQRSNVSTLNDLLDLLHREIEQDYVSSSTASTTRLSLACRKHIVKLTAFLFKDLMFTSDDDVAIRRVLQGLLDGLRSADAELQVSALDGLLHFISTPTIVGEGAKAKEDDTIKQRKVRFGTLANEVGVFPLLHSTAANALGSTTHQSHHDVLLSRLPLVFTQCLAQFENNENVLKKLVRDYCVSPVLVGTATDRNLLVHASSSCLLLSALFLSNSKLALWATQQTGNDGSLLLLRLHTFLLASRTFTGPREWTRRLQEIWVDCVASVCGAENGTSCVPPPLRVEIYKMLQAALDEDDLVLRASALSIQIKIAVVEKTMETESVDTAFLIEQVFDVLEEAHEYEKKALEKQLYWSGASPKERGIEALSYIITLTHVKDAFVKRPKAIESLFQVEFASSKDKSSDHHTHVGYRSNVYYGIGYILHHVLTSESALKRKQMEGMEMTPEQYEELQKALRQKSALEDGDSPENVRLRVNKLVESSAMLATLVQLLKYATTKSYNVVEMAVLSALHAADVPAVRGKLVQSGVFQALIPLSMHITSAEDSAKKPKGTTLSNAAGQAMARILISTNPNLVSSSSLFSSIKPLLDLCKGETQLLQFEALMALTNIASVSDETKNRIVTEPQGLSTLQYLQFSEHELVRRAATEAICNLLPNDQVIEKVFMNEEKVRLWLAFASVEEEEEDFETARAASGALAMVSQVPQVSWVMMKQGGLQAFLTVLEVSKHEETLHRALFALENMLSALHDSTEAEQADEKQAFLGALKEHRTFLTKKMKELITGAFAPSTQEAAQACFGALIKCLGK
ncbi:hypothetical protein Poli38472_001982 [Pythium oligandrum]|uniref:Protein unc-45 homolog B n=1 Tax=Pythium oligandrum TaxID=41045 RepID=A0A8K1FNW2_PYTOL|nr:hypothetical protein Poli38472_001982 [Pythium oligandrum]|eukprot:TMW69826.1 hypothetical protein Poli38472_001982 [Pythium oligandrum]